MKIREIDLPAEDRDRLTHAIRPGAAAFVTPNHPEYMTDWLLDKEVSRRVSPLMAHWASYEVVNSGPVAQWFWLRNNLIANAPGGKGREYSLRWARAGHGVLLHPEGRPTGHCDWIAPLVSGAIDMAMECSQSGDDSVFLVPIAWRLAFTRNVARELERELERLERAIPLPDGAGLALPDRFAQLHCGVLAESVRRFGAGRDAQVEARTLSSALFFQAQEAHRRSLIDRLLARHGSVSDGHRFNFHHLRRSIHELASRDRHAARRDRTALAEIERLSHFTKEQYGSPTLSQEQIAESLQHLRLALLRRRWRDRLHQVLPVAVAPRVARIRVPEPIAVRAAELRGDDLEATRQRLLADLRLSLQSQLDRLNVSIAELTQCFAVENPFLR